MSSFSGSSQSELWALCSYKAGQGGHNAFHGVVSQFAQRVGLAISVLNPKVVEADFLAAVELLEHKMPSSLGAQSETQLTRSLRVRNQAIKQIASELLYGQYKNECPVAILSSFNKYFTFDHLLRAEPTTIALPPETFVAENLNINTWSEYLPESYRGLAPHNLSFEILQQEAKKFHSVIKQDNRPLIGIVLAEYYPVSCSTVEKFRDIASTMPDARFVVVSSPRYPGSVLKEFCHDFQELLNSQQREDFTAYNFDADAPNKNPYKALLTLADHMIIIGESTTMVSERLFAGRDVHYGWGWRPESVAHIFGGDLLASGKIRALSNDSGLTTKHFTPIDSTGMVVDTLVSDYEAFQAQPKNRPKTTVSWALEQKLRRTVAHLL